MPSTPGERPNIVVILADDQRWDTLWAMPLLQETLVRFGVTFTNAFVSTPLCCPSRASFLSGGYYAQNTGVLHNALPNGGVQRFLDTNTLPLRLKEAGYATALVGKYMNEYQKVAPYIPPGWSRFVSPFQYMGWSRFDVAIGGSGAEAAQGATAQVHQYSTDYLRDQALTFLNDVGEQPFFLMITPDAPHFPAIPAPGDEQLFGTYRYRSRGWGEISRADKPEHVQQTSWPNASTADELHRNQLRSLQAVDRMVGNVVSRLGAQNKLQNTVFVYMSDNGYLWGEHRLAGKILPYEEAIHVPLVVRMPGILPREESTIVASNLDVPALISELAGLPAQGDGISLMPVLQNPRSIEISGGIFLESWPYKEFLPHLPSWVAWRTPDCKYVEHSTGERELYDFFRDSYELDSQHDNPIHASEMAKVSAYLDLKRGLSITTPELPVGQVVSPYSAALTAWGGTPPYAWSLTGELPPGLTFDGVTGMLSGTATEPGNFLLEITVTSQKLATQRNEPQRYVLRTTLTILGAESPGKGTEGE